IPDTDIVDYVVPEGYTAISSEVFKNCKKLESITIPDSVKTIEGGAFNEHKTLKRVSLPAGISIGGRAFYHCESLESVTVRKDSEAGASTPENAEIGDEAFAECRKLTHMEVPGGVKTIGVRAFDLCQAMKTIEIPDSVEKIEWCAFNHCNALEEVTLSANHPVSIGHNAFRYCYALRHFRFPPGVTQIEESVFAASGLQSVELCDGMKAIGEDAFGGCRKLREINLPDTLETIGYGAFRDCNSLNIPSMPANMKKIGNEAFLKTDELPLESLVKIVLESDTGGSPLSPNPNRPETVLPDRIETFAPAFDLSQRKLAFSPGNTRYHFTEEGVLIDNETKTLLRAPLLLDGHYTIPDGIRAIGPWAFRGCRIRSVTIPASVTSIGAGAFSKTCLEEVSIPASVTEFREEELVSGLTIPRQYVLDNQNIPLLDFEQGVFAYCPALKRVTLPETMKTIPTAMFSNCGSLEEITLPDGLAGIGKCAFMRSGLKEIVIPESTRSIAKNAFHGAPCAQKVQNQYKHLME
ncbi:MAG: leucine-rich repeat domain-containing protein, partial [Lentisphaeria bacterium]|nr:leucine-rich repeat domain-containing protein [Lentisphaeria bacterium]